MISCGDKRPIIIVGLPYNFHQKISAKGRNFLQFYYNVVYKFITSACYNIVSNKEIKFLF